MKAMKEQKKFEFDTSEKRTETQGRIIGLTPLDKLKYVQTDSKRWGKIPNCEILSLLENRPLPDGSYLNDGDFRLLNLLLELTQSGNGYCNWQNPMLALHLNTSLSTIKRRIKKLKAADCIRIEKKSKRLAEGVFVTDRKIYIQTKTVYEYLNLEELNELEDIYKQKMQELQKEKDFGDEGKMLIKIPADPNQWKGLGGKPLSLEDYKSYRIHALRDELYDMAIRNGVTFEFEDEASSK